MQLASFADKVSEKSLGIDDGNFFIIWCPDISDSFLRTRLVREREREMCACVCMRERERVCACVCEFACVCVKERERGSVCGCVYGIKKKIESVRAGWWEEKERERERKRKLLLLLFHRSPFIWFLALFRKRLNF